MFQSSYVLAGQTSKGAVVKDNDYLYVMKGGTAIGTDLSGEFWQYDAFNGKQRIYSGAGTMFVSGGTIKDTVCKNGATLNVDFGGKAYNTKIHDALFVTVVNGTAYGTKLTGQADFILSDKGIAYNTTVNTDNFIEYKDKNGRLCLRKSLTLC